MDPETQVVNHTFYDFADHLENGDDNNSNNSTPLLPMKNLQQALIQLLNRHIPSTLIEDALKDCGGFDSSIEELTLPEFRGIYKR